MPLYIHLFVQDADDEDVALAYGFIKDDVMSGFDTEEIGCNLFGNVCSIITSYP